MGTMGRVGGAAVGSMLLVACGGSTPAPSTSTTGASYPETVRVAIAHDGTTTFDGRQVSGAELTDRTREAARQQPNLKLVVDAERETSFQLVLTAVERMKAGGASSIAFGTVVAAPPATTTAAGQAAAPTAKAAGPVTGPTPAPHASIPAGTKWDCPFPSAGGGRSEANVLVRVHVENDGKPLSVDVLEDPGAGFAEAAKACALGKAYEAARDVNGQPIRATTFPFYIHFVTK